MCVLTFSFNFPKFSIIVKITPVQQKLHGKVAGVARPLVSIRTYRVANVQDTTWDL